MKVPFPLDAILTIVYLNDHGKMQTTEVKSGDAPFKVKNILNNDYYLVNRDEHPIVLNNGNCKRMKVHVHREITKVEIIDDD